MAVRTWGRDDPPAGVLRAGAQLLREKKAGEWTLMLATLLDDVARDADDARVVNGSLDLSFCDCPAAIESALAVAVAYLAEAGQLAPEGAPGERGGGLVMCELPGDCPRGPEPHPFAPPVTENALPCCRQPWEARDDR